MANRTQIRLQQVSGSLMNLKSEAAQYVTPAASSALTGSDLQDILGVFAASLNRIHGAASDEPFNNLAGVIRSANNQAAAIKLHADAGSSVPRRQSPEKKKKKVPFCSLSFGDFSKKREARIS